MPHAAKVIPANPRNAGTAAVVSTATSEARELLKESFARLKEVSSGGATGKAGDKFFPNGIELIYVKVEAGLTEKTKVVVEVKIAGPKAGSASMAAEIPTG